MPLEVGLRGGRRAFASQIKLYVKLHAKLLVGITWAHGVEAPFVTAPLAGVLTRPRYQDIVYQNRRLSPYMTRGPLFQLHQKVIGGRLAGWLRPSLFGGIRPFSFDWFRHVFKLLGGITSLKMMPPVIIRTGLDKTRMGFRPERYQAPKWIALTPLQKGGLPKRLTNVSLKKGGLLFWALGPRAGIYPAPIRFALMYH